MCGATMIRFAEALLPDGFRVVRVKSWRPAWVNGCMEWPCLLVEAFGRTMTVWPVWDRARLRTLFRVRDADRITLSME